VLRMALPPLIRTGSRPGSASVPDETARQR
jgi:hypothetical protein